MKILKKLAVLGVALCAAGTMASAPAWAGVVDSRHDVTNTSAGNTYVATLGVLAEFGTCSACHIPHGAGADKLFPPTNSTPAYGGTFGGLCGSCHDSAAFGAGTDNIWVDNSAFNEFAHGLSIADLGLLGDDYSLADPSDLIKYENGEASEGANIECLSCHDVHNQTSNRPFLLMPLENLCQYCHTNRASASLADTGFSNSLGTHPSGSWFTGDMGAATGVVKTPINSPIVFEELASNTDVNADGSSWADTFWDSGSHLQSGGVGCVTCHTVHWQDNNNTDHASVFLGFVDGGQVDMVDTASANLFCEECHRGSLSFPGGTDYATYWNPGQLGTYSHPNDEYENLTLTAADVTGHTIFQPVVSSLTHTSGGSTLVCTSCHGVHRSDTTVLEAQPNSPALLPYAPGAADICASCHESGVTTFNHHPIGGSYATSGNTVGGLSCSGGDTGLGVGTCHGGRNGAAAHNRLTPLGAGLDTNCSTMCTNCHTTNPSIYTPSNTYTADGLASHFIGNASLQTWDRTTSMDATLSGDMRWAGIGDGTTAWVTTGLLSKGGAGDTVCGTSTIICEGCHRLAAGNYVSGNKPSSMMIELSGSAVDTMDTLLPEKGGTWTPGGTDQYTTAPYICTGCHLIPSGTHPLLNATGSAYTPSNPKGESYTGTGTVNCESCHSPHDADTSSGSYILDGSAIDPALFGTNTDAMAVEPEIDYTDFCAVCHADFK